LPAGVGQNPFYLVGNTSSPGSVVINVTNATAIFATAGASISVQGFTLQASGTGPGAGNGFEADNGGEIVFASCVFAACSTAHMYSATGGTIWLTSPSVYTISGSAGVHVSADAGGFISLENGTLTINNTPAFSGAFASCSRCSNIQVIGMTFNGSATGQRYASSLNAVIDVNGQSATYLPGSTTGAVSAGGIYA
jgi:hypothetical protein